MMMCDDLGVYKMAKKLRPIGQEEIDELQLSSTSAREKAYLRDFQERYTEEEQDVTVKELLEAKKVALLRYRDSICTNNEGASKCAIALLQEMKKEEGEEE